MSEYTKGPWQVATSCSWRRIVNDHMEPVCIPTIQSSDNHPDLEFPNGGANGPDASLLCAAPELYEALCDMVSDHKDLSEATLAYARRVLAQARGESHE